MSPELAIFEYFDEAITAATGDDPLVDCALHETVYAAIKTLKGIRIGDSTADVGPHAGETKEFNVLVPLQIFRRVEGTDYKTAREDLRELALKVAGLVFADSSLGSRVCDARIVEPGRRGWAKVQTTVYAVQVYTLLVNARGYRGGS